MIIAVALVSLFVILSSMAISFDIPTSIYTGKYNCYYLHYTPHQTHTTLLYCKIRLKVYKKATNTFSIQWYYYSIIIIVIFNL